MSVTNALMVLGQNALAPTAGGAIQKATTNALVNKIAQDTATKALTKGLTGAGMSSLAPKAGSTLDGILGRSSGLVLPEPNVKVPTLAESAKALFPDEDVSTIGGMIQKFEGSNLDKIYQNKGLSKKSYDTLKAGAREAADIMNPVEEMNAIGITSKSGLPTLNRDQYYTDTLGKVGAKSPLTGKQYVSGADVPDYMKNHLSNNTNGKQNDSILRELFNDDTSDLSELYEKYENIAQGSNANEVYTPDNIDIGVELMGKEGKKAEQDFADRLFRGKRDIAISGGASPAKNVKVSRPTAMGAEATATAPATNNPALAGEVAELKAKLGSAGGGMRGGGTPIASATPDYGGLGDSGFKVNLKEGKTTNITIGNDAVGSTKQQRAIRKLDDMTAKSMNANAKQYRGLVGKSGSIDGHYKTVAERMRAEKIDQANVAQKAQSALSLREDIKQQGLQYAEANGVTLNLAGIDNTIGLSATQKRKLAELGLGLDEMLGGDGMVTPTQAEDIYKTLRDYAYNWSDSKDALTKMAGNACEKEANAVRDLIDKTMDNINVDYKTSLLEEAAKNGEDPAYLRALAGKKDFKFSDLRKDQSDWIAMNDLAGNKIKEEPTMNVFGVDTGMKNPFTSGAEKIKEKIYERQAYGNGAENTINFTSPTGSGTTGTLGGLLGKAKNTGLIGAGILGGMMLGGGGQSSNSGDLAGMSYDPTAGATEAEPTADPMATMTMGGYTYQELEDGYMRAVSAGDEASAKLIANMMKMLDDKMDRYYTAQKNAGDSSSSSGVSGKQKAALNVLSGLMQNYQAQGPIGGRFTQLLNAITGGGYAPGIAAYDSGSQGSLGTIIKALGDTGALSEGDQKRALSLLPKTTDSPEAAKMKYQQLIQILQGAGAQ